MKITTRYIFIFGLLLFANWHIANATHYRSGEIFYSLAGDRAIQASVIIYTKVSPPSNLADRDTITVDWGDGTTDALRRSNGVDIDPPDGYPDGVLVAPDIKKSIYKAYHHYAANSPNSFFVVSFLDQNRMAGINNISNGNSVEVPFYIEATVFLNAMMALGKDSSPFLLNPPVDFANVNENFTFNPVAYDADGDSLVFELVTPLSGPAIDVPLYQYPNDYCNQQVPNGIFNIDQNTGQITWSTPCVQGFFNIAFKVKEYRCGILLGTVMRDMQIIALDEPNVAPVISFIGDTVISPGEKLQYQVTGTDPNSGQKDSLKFMGGAFLLSAGAPVFQSTVANPASGTFTWQTDSSHARPHAWIFSVYASDNYSDNSIPANLKAYTTFRVWVADTTSCLVSGIEEQQALNSSVVIFPNPLSSNSCTISVGNELMGVQLDIYDSIGRMLDSRKITNPSTELTLNIPPGLYFLRFHSPGMDITKKLIHL